MKNTSSKTAPPLHLSGDVTLPYFIDTIYKGTERNGFALKIGII